MHWKGGVNLVKNTNIKKRWGVHDPPSSYRGAAPGGTIISLLLIILNLG